MRRFASPRLAACALCCLLLVACTEEGSTGLDELPGDLLVTWFATSLRVGGQELMDDGMRLGVSFASDGSYQFVASRDGTAFVCDPGLLDCVVDGTFDASATEVVFDPGEDEARLSATLTATSLPLFGTVEATSVDLTFVVPAYPDLIGTWLASALFDSEGVIEEGGRPTTFAVTFEADGSYRYASTFSPPDLFCDPDLSCLGEGTYVADADLGELTFDPGLADALTMQLVISPTQLVLSGFVDGGLQDWTLEKLAIPSPGLEGSWWALSLDFAGSDLENAGAVHQLTFVATTYFSSVTSQAPGPFLCADVTASPDCSASGAFTANLRTVDFVDGLAAGPQTLSVEVTPTSLRLFGTLEGDGPDLLYVRVPPFF